MNRENPFSKLVIRLGLVFILWLGWAVRLVGLNNVSPPGLEHDEVAHWLINNDILAGNHAIYFSEAYGHEALYHYFQAGFTALTGDNALTLRLPSVYMGLLGLAVSYALAGRLFGKGVALTAVAWLAVLFWPVFYSRLALRAIGLPLFSGLSAYFWWRGWQRGEAPAGSFLLSGLFAGLSLHTYFAGRTVPIFYLLFTGYLFLFHRPKWRQKWAAIGLFWLTMVVVAAPLFFYLLTHPGLETRVAEVDGPLRALLAGDVRPVLSNSLKILLMFGGPGDPLWRQGVAFRPVYDFLTALFFYACLPFCLARLSDERYLFVIFWLFTSFIPSVVTIDAPSSIRIINILPVLTLLPAITIHNWGQLSTERDKLSTANWVIWGLTALLFLGHLGRTLYLTFVVWPNNAEVQFVWQQALSEAATYLDNSPDISPVAIGGWTPETMDAATMELTLHRQDLRLAYFRPDWALIVPAGANARLIRPTILPLLPYWEKMLGITGQANGSFTLYQWQRGEVPAGLPTPLNFGNEILLLGYEWLPPADSLQPYPFEIVTYWQVIRPPNSPRRIFLHLLNGQGQPISQDDRLDAPAGFWQTGDLIWQRLKLEMAPAGTDSLRLGLYNPETDQRLLLPDQKEFLTISPDWFNHED